MSQGARAAVAATASVAATSSTGKRTLSKANGKIGFKKPSGTVKTLAADLGLTTTKPAASMITVRGAASYTAAQRQSIQRTAATEYTKGKLAAERKDVAQTILAARVQSLRNTNEASISAFENLNRSITAGFASLSAGERAKMTAAISNFSKLQNQLNAVSLERTQTIRDLQFQLANAIATGNQALTDTINEQIGAAERLAATEFDKLNAQGKALNLELGKFGQGVKDAAGKAQEAFRGVQAAAAAAAAAGKAATKQATEDIARAAAAGMKPRGKEIRFTVCTLCGGGVHGADCAAVQGTAATFEASVTEEQMKYLESRGYSLFADGGMMYLKSTEGGRLVGAQMAINEARRRFPTL